MIIMNYDTIIVGGGIAGLTAGAYLARAGKEVLLLEKNSICGGLVNTIEHNGFSFDAGLKALEDAGIIKTMLHDLGIELPFYPNPVSIGIEDTIIALTERESIETYKNLLIKYYPESVNEINRLIPIVEKFSKYVDTLYAVENPEFKDLKNDRDFIFTKLLPWLPKFLYTLNSINKLMMPVESYLQKFITNRSLLDMIAQHFFRDMPAFFALGYFSLYLNYFYPAGGTGMLAKVLEDTMRSHGGEIQYNTKITRVYPGIKKIYDETNAEYGYNTLIWASDLKTFYAHLLDNNLDKQTLRALRKKQQEILLSRGGDSVFELFLEVDEPPETFKAITTGHLLYAPSRKGLGDVHKGELETILAQGNSITKEIVMDWLERFLALNTYEISIPVLKDPKMAPSGKTGIVVNFFIAYDIFNVVQQAGWYDEFRERIERGVIEVLSKSIFPMLKEKCKHYFSYTPLSIKNWAGTSEGAITGWSFSNAKPAVSNMLQVNKSVQTPFCDIFQAGQWTYSPSGVPMAILTGKIASRMILNHN